MFTYQVIFFLSLSFIVLMMLSRLAYKKLHDEHLFHKVVTHKARKVNLKLKEGYRKFKNFLKYFNKKTFTLLIHLIIEKVEEYFHKLTDYIRSKFPHNK